MKRIVTILILIMSLNLSGCLSSGELSSIEITINDCTFNPVRNTLQDLLDQGYTYEINELYEAFDKVEGRSYTGRCIDICKDGKIKFSVGLYNDSAIQCNILDATIGDVQVWIYEDRDDYETANKVVFNGYDILNATIEETKEKFKDEKVSVYDDSLIIYFDKYSYEINFDENNKIKYLEFDLKESDL